eukprot:TRINITY_DN14644_c0_g2_i1.p1 TRINITY_DN14644_c0_g2~~TRINITY_DN14644_c0_g2_i1.p1  ORF type:complete len:550 (+),score=66.31 TRINITY_DN14644_c0_g2_i1:77-1726(+)
MRAHLFCMMSIWARLMCVGLWSAEAFMDRSAVEHSENRRSRELAISKHLGHAASTGASRHQHGHLQKKASTSATSHFQMAGKYAQEPYTDVEHESYLSRLGNALIGVFVGIFVVIPFSIALLWVNERRNAQLESLLGLGQSEAETIEGSRKDLDDYDGTLVHMDSEKAIAMSPVQDSRFSSVKMDSGCLRLQSIVEVFQWSEEEHQEKKKDRVGGGETTIKTYTYKKVWSRQEISSANFKQRNGHENTFHIKDLRPGLQETCTSLAKYGDQHELPSDMVKQLNNFEDASKLVGQELRYAAFVFQKGQDDWYQCPMRLSSPEIGDTRVKFQYVLDGPASILALQMEDKKKGCRTFGPYRSVRRRFCGGSTDSEMKELRVQAAKKSDEDLYEDEKCWDFGPFACLCCCCNCVAKIFTSMRTSQFSLVPEIYRVLPGQKSMKECFAHEYSVQRAAKWAMRLLGWVLLWAGFSMIFYPLQVIPDIIPFLGPFLSSGIGWVVGLLSFLFTLALAFLIISIAYLIYHPLIGVLYMIATAGVVAFIAYLSHLHAPQ